jgi:hypothetical protein
MTDYYAHSSGYDLELFPPGVSGLHSLTLVTEGKGDDQGDHETPTPAPSTEVPTDAPSPTPSTTASPSPAPSTEVPSTPFPTEPADTTAPGADAGPSAPAAGLPVTSGPDVWIGFAFVVCAVLAVVAGAVMTRAARRIGARP